MTHSVLNAVLVCVVSSHGQLPEAADGKSSTQTATYRALADIQYAEVEEHKLLLDLYVPRNVERPPLVVWVHGGTWRRGSKRSLPLTSLVDHGYAMASGDS